MVDSLVLEDVCMSYGQGVPVLRSVSLRLIRGEIIGVIGSTSSRTALLEVMGGDLSPDHGRMILSGVDPMTLSRKKRLRFLKSHISLVGDWMFKGFSISQCIDLSLLGLDHRPREARSFSLAALQRMDVAHCASSRWPRLLRRDQVRVALAYCLAVRSPFIVLDGYLFDGLGPLHMQEVGGLLRLLIDEIECGVLLSLADMESAQVTDRLLNFERGRLTPVDDELMSSSNMALAHELYQRGHANAAAILAGSSLEEHLRRLVLKIGAPGERDGLPRKADALNNTLVGVGVYNRLQHKEVTAWLELRNKAVHGQHSEYDAAHVSRLIRAVQDFMTRFPA